MRTTVVGSYPLPTWLRTSPTREALRDAMLVVLKTQELAGIDVLVDGELSRFDINHPETNGMIDYFVGRMSGIRTRLERQELADFRTLPGMQFRAAPAGIVEGAIGEGLLDLPAECAKVRPLTTRPLKFTLTGPHMLAKTLVNRHYRDVAEVADGIAAVLAKQVAHLQADVIQLDEANITGHPEEAPWAAAALNRVLDAISGKKGVHACFGNYGGQSIQKGYWAKLLPYLNALHCDHLLLEFARRGYDELATLRELRPEIALGIGVIDIKDNEIESADTVARRIDQAVKVLGRDRVQWVHPDCGFWMLPRNVADGKMRSLVAGRDRFLGQA